MKRVLILGTFVGLLLGTGVAPVEAAESLSCGDTVTDDVKLECDLECGDGPGLIVGADDVTIDLNGFTISSTTGVGVGIDIDGYEKVKIKGGAIEGFAEGIHAENADKLKIENMDIIGASGPAASTGAIHVIDSNHVDIKKCFVQVTTVFLGAHAIRLDSVKKAHVDKCEIDGGFIGVSFFSVDPTDAPTTGHIKKCTIEDCFIGILCANTDDAKIEDNLIQDGNDAGLPGNSQGIRIGLSNIGVSNIEIEKNEITNISLGMLGAAGNPLTDLKIKDNDIHDNIGGGMQMVLMQDSKVEKNDLCDNGTFGLALNNSTDNKIEKNDISGNGVRGLVLVFGANDNEIKKNDVNGNGIEGITLFLGANTGNLIKDNDAADNGTFDMFHNAASTPNTWEKNTCGTSSGADIDCP